MTARATTTTDGRTTTFGTFHGATDVWEAHALAARYTVTLLAGGGRVDPVAGERGAYVVTPDDKPAETIRVVED